MSTAEKKEKLQDAIGLIGDDLIVGAKKKNRLLKLSHRKMALIAAVLVVVLVATTIIYPMRYSFVYSQYVVVAAEYPSLFGESDADRDARIEAYEESVDGLEDFYMASISEFLKESNGQNVAYSPINVLIGLSMVAEITGGDSRAKILEALGVDNVELLRQKINDIWLANYDKYNGTCVLANSIWMDDSITYKKDALNILAKNYYAYSFYGDISSIDYTRAMQAWLNEQSDNLLKDINDNLYVNANVSAMLMSTMNFEDKWKEEFKTSDTTEQVFHAVTGDVTCQFMNGSDEGVYYKGELFTAVSRAFKSGADMWFILPDEGITIDDLLKDGEAMEFMVKADKKEAGELTNSCEGKTIELTVPKFDITSQIDLKDGMKNLGIDDIFDYGIADFSPLLGENSGCAIGMMNQAVRVYVDEEGAKTVAQFVASVDSKGASDCVEIVLDRPFICVITSEAGAPLSVAVVNQP